MTTQAVLFTNIEVVSMGDISTHSRALLLHRLEIRGFLYNSVTPSFALRGLESLEYAVTPVEIYGVPTRNVLIKLDGHEQELLVSLTNGNDDPINVTTFDPGLAELDYAEMWDVLNRRIVAYWTAPYFLESRQVSIHDARQKLGIVGR